MKGECLDCLIFRITRYNDVKTFLVRGTVQPFMPVLRQGDSVMLQNIVEVA
jgi:hypothetical protein